MKKLCTIFLILAVLPAFLLADNRDASAKYEQARKRMVSEQIHFRGLSDPKVLDAMGKVPRHLFVPERLRFQAYADHPLPIDEGQTISQPYIVALMTESLGITKEMKVLEIGTGSGYQAAVLANIAKETYTIEIKEKLYRASTKRLQSLGFKNIHTRLADGYFGWTEAAPFDCIMITAAVNHIPRPLLEQLKDKGRLILPLGNPFSYQNLVLVTKQGADYTVKQITGVLFVPMTGRALERDK